MQHSTLFKFLSSCKSTGSKVSSSGTPRIMQALVNRLMFSICLNFMLDSLYFLIVSGCILLINLQSNIPDLKDSTKSLLANFSPVTASIQTLASSSFSFLFIASASLAFFFLRLSLFSHLHLDELSPLLFLVAYEALFRSFVLDLRFVGEETLKSRLLGLGFAFFQGNHFQRDLGIFGRFGSFRCRRRLRRQGLLLLLRLGFLVLGLLFSGFLIFLGFFRGLLVLGLLFGGFLIFLGFFSGLLVLGLLFSSFLIGLGFCGCLSRLFLRRFLVLFGFLLSGLWDFGGLRRFGLLIAFVGLCFRTGFLGLGQLFLPLLVVLLFIRLFGFLLIAVGGFFGSGGLGFLGFLVVILFRIVGLLRRLGLLGLLVVVFFGIVGLLRGLGLLAIILFGLLAIILFGLLPVILFGLLPVILFFSFRRPSSSF